MNHFTRWSSGCICGLVVGVVLAWTMTGKARDARPPQDRDALVALAQLVETEHRRVDLLVKAGDRAGAIRALEQIADGAWPSEERAGEAAVWMRHDVVGRLVRLELDDTPAVPPHLEALLGRITRRLNDGGGDLPPNAFTARLAGLQGELLERAGRDQAALASYEVALDMNRLLLDALIKEDL
jgi:hypothetical protein